MADGPYDLIIIGGGPGGYVAASHAARKGLKVACVEQEPLLGGTCLRVGCIPSKALLESSELYHEAKENFATHGVKVGEVSIDVPAMMARKTEVVESLAKGVAGLFKQTGVTRLAGHGKLLGGGKVKVSGADEQTIQGKDVLLVTGSKVASIPGVEIDGDRVVGSTEALDFESVPERLIVIGAGYIGLELGSVWARLGSRVTVLEYLDRILPGMDAEIAKIAQRVFRKQGLEFRLGAKVTGARTEGDQAVVQIDGGEPLTADRVLVAVGRKPNTDDLGLDAVGVVPDDKGRIPVDEHFRAADNVYAIGDVIVGPMLAHKAEAEAVAFVDRLTEGHGAVNYDVIPGIVYTQPEIATVGKTEEELKKADVPYRKGVTYLRANGRAKVLGHDEGQVKVLAHADTDRILGVHIIGIRAGDLIAEAAAAMQFGASAEDLAHTVHAHPTLSETVRDAAAAATG